MTDGGRLPSISAGSSTKPLELGPTDRFALHGLEATALLATQWLGSIKKKCKNFLYYHISSGYRNSPYHRPLFYCKTTVLVSLITHLGPNWNGPISISLLFVARSVIQSCHHSSNIHRIVCHVPGTVRS